MEVKLIGHTPNPIQAMAQAAATCYDSKPSAKIVEHCLQSGHESITEFATFHFEVSGISRACSHQLVRHRLASYAQRSQRYCNEAMPAYVVPDSIRKNPTFCREFELAAELAFKVYHYLLEQGVPAEDARYILPNACETVLHVAMNFRELRHFCEERLCSRAQWEIRAVAEQMAALVNEVEPLLGKYLVPKCERLGYCPETKSCGRKPKKE